MILNIMIREIQHNLLSLRLQIAFILSIVIFSLGSIAFIKSHADNVAEYKRYHNDFIENMREDAEENLTQMAINSRQLIMAPRGSNFIDDAKERYTPNRFYFSAYNIFGYDVNPGSTNPFLNAFQELNWIFIVSVIISFTVLLFTFDTVSGEKEHKTLAISLANSLSRGNLLFGKYLSVILTTLLILLPGLCLSLIIILLSGSVAIHFNLILEIAGFLLAAIILTACIAAFGLLASVLTYSARTSLLYALCFWLLFISFMPNTAVFWASTIFPIEKGESVEERIRREQEDINNNAPPGSWSSSGGNPFLPQHELRANNQTNLMNARVSITKAYYNTRFQQFERVKLLTFLSPVSLYSYLNESIVGGGYPRFQKVWNDLHGYQAQLLQFFKEKDANDPDSPHWYNPYEDYSTTRKPAKFEEVPIFEEKPLSFPERFKYAGLYLLVLVLYTAGIFILAFVRFLKYDVR